MSMDFLMAPSNERDNHIGALEDVIELLRMVPDDRNSVMVSAVTTVIEELLSASPEQISEASSVLTRRESTDIEVLLKLAEIAAARSHRGLTRREHLARYHVEAVIELRKMLAEAGGSLDRRTVAKLRKMGEKSIDKAVRERRLLAVPSGQGREFPVWQFDGGDLVEGFVEVLQALPSASPWEHVEFFLTPVDDLLDGMSPIEALRKREHFDTVLRLARTHLSQDAA